MSPGPAPLSGSTSAPRHCPPEWAVVMAPSSLVTRSQERIKMHFSQAVWDDRCDKHGYTTQSYAQPLAPPMPRWHVCHCHPQVLILSAGDKLRVTRPPCRLPSLYERALWEFKKGAIALTQTGSDGKAHMQAGLRPK